MPQSTAKAAFAVLDTLELEDDPSADFAAFAGQANDDWRIERRYRRRKADGALIMYWNYRRRKISRSAEGRRRIEYRKGGSRQI